MIGSHQNRFHEAPLLCVLAALRETLFAESQSSKTASSFAAEEYAREDKRSTRWFPCFVRVGPWQSKTAADREYMIRRSAARLYVE